MAIRGGKKLAAFFKRARRQAKRTQGIKTEIGFLEPRMATLAATHELGQRDKDGSSKMPPRPAFGAALRDLRQAYRTTLRKRAGGSIEGVTMGMLGSAAKAGAAAVKASYERGAPGRPVGPGQAARKAGTPGEGKLLVGTEGPKLAEHVRAEVDGRPVS